MGHKRRISFDMVCQYIWVNYGGCCVSRLVNSNGNVVPKCYVAYYDNPIVFTRDKRKAEKYGYTYIEDYNKAK